MTAKLTSRIPIIIKNLKPSMMEGLAEAAEEIAEDARNRAPIDQGDLKVSIHVETTEDEVAIVAGDEDVFYGHFVEFGTTNTGAQPFLIPAYEAGKAKIEDVVGEKLEDL